MVYEIKLEFEDLAAIKYSFGFDYHLIKKKIAKIFIPLLIRYISKEIKNKKQQAAVVS